jgi:hypothetical protein
VSGNPCSIGVLLIKVQGTVFFFGELGVILMYGDFLTRKRHDLAA